MSQLAAPIVVTIAGVVLGTIAGARLLRRVPDRWFRSIVALILTLLGLVVPVHAFR